MTRPGRTLAVATTASALALVAFVTPQATATRTAEAFTAGSSGLAWMLAAMPLALAVTLLPAGAAGDDHGRRRVFAAGLGLLAVGAALCAAAPGTVVFVVGRLVQGAGAAGVLACGLGLLAAAFPTGPERARATGAWGASLVLAATAAALASGAGGTALVSYLPTLVQAGLGRSLLVASLLTALFAGTSVLTALQARRLPPALPTWVLMATALVVLAGAQLALAGVQEDSGVGRLVPGLALGGIAYGVLNAALGQAAVTAVPEGRASVGSGANNTARYLASAVGVTVVALLPPAGRTPGVDAEVATAALVDGWTTATVITAAVSLVGAAAVVALRPARDARPA